MTTSTQQLKLNLNSALNEIKLVINNEGFLNCQYENTTNEELIFDKDKAAYYSTSQDAQDTEPGINYWPNILS